MALIDTLLNSTKPVNFSSNDVKGLEDQIEILDITAGGMDNFREEPFAFYYCEPIPPLYHPRESTDKLKLIAENRIPTVYIPYCMLGATAPITFSAALLNVMLKFYPGW